MITYNVVVLEKKHCHIGVVCEYVGLEICSLIVTTSNVVVLKVHSHTRAFYEAVVKGSQTRDFDL